MSKLYIKKCDYLQRVAAPPEIHHERLFVVSMLGFIVNLVGIFVFQHGGEHASHHGHSHAGGGHGHSHSLFGGSSSSSSSSSPSSCSHGHSHDNHTHSHSHGGDDCSHGHSHGDDYHGHSHDDHAEQHHHAEGNKIFEGVFLHILADTLGNSLLHTT